MGEAKLRAAMISEDRRCPANMIVGREGRLVAKLARGGDVINTKVSPKLWQLTSCKQSHAVRTNRSEAPRWTRSRRFCPLGTPQRHRVRRASTRPMAWSTSLALPSTACPIASAAKPSGRPRWTRRAIKQPVSCGLSAVSHRIYTQDASTLTHRRGGLLRGRGRCQATGPA